MLEEGDKGEDHRIRGCGGSLALGLIPVAAQDFYAALDAAIGKGDNRAVIETIRQGVNARLEVGGGIRTLQAAQAWLERVASRPAAEMSKWRWRSAERPEAERPQVST